ncbi:MAG: DUF4143 domain-containing protein, partial [Muribaculaceae bacterium]|nr:DUF4143 domain-containing protein [Muribaculaceae bacterium]
YESFLFIDFSTAPADILNLFNDLSDLNYILMRLQLYYNVSLTPRKSAVVFDEVQFQPRARQAIKHFVADGRFDYIETGSLISIKKNVKDILIPSEEETLYMHPLDYEEFRWALGDTATIPLLREIFQLRRPLGDAVHRKLLRDFRLYMLVGGMPQAVSEYIDKGDLRSVDDVKRRIIKLYEDDFYKIDALGRISALYDSIPARLNNGAAFRVNTILGTDSDTETIEQMIAELRASMTVNISFHANDPHAGMSLTKDFRRYKIFVGDTGLAVTLAFKDKEFTDNDIYTKLWNDKLGSNLGFIYENIVAQTLVATGKDLFYYTFPSESGKHNYEIDFLLPDSHKISPVEVKSSGYKRHTSLDRFCEKYSDRILNRYLLYTKDIHKNGSTLCLPVYLAQFL